MQPIWGAASIARKGRAEDVVGLVKVESSEGITTITMTRADKRNALNQVLCDELCEAY